MQTIRNNPIVINSGIDNIVRENHVEVDVPERVPLAPSETIPVPRLDRLLAFPTIDEFIAEQLLPRFDDGAIFTPQRFRALLEMAPEALRAAAEHQPAAARPLGKAARLLVESVSMHDLLHMYRSALFQG